MSDFPRVLIIRVVKLSRDYFLCTALFLLTRKKSAKNWKFQGCLLEDFLMVGIFLFVLLHYELVAFVAFCMPKNTCICNMYFIHHPFKGERAYSSRICGLDGCPSILFLHKPNWHFFRFALHRCLSSKWHKLPSYLCIWAPFKKIWDADNVRLIPILTLIGLKWD